MDRWIDDTDWKKFFFWLKCLLVFSNLFLVSFICLDLETICFPVIVDWLSSWDWKESLGCLAFDFSFHCFRFLFSRFDMLCSFLILCCFHFFRRFLFLDVECGWSVDNRGFYENVWFWFSKLYLFGDFVSQIFNHFNFLVIFLTTLEMFLWSI